MSDKLEKRFVVASGSDAFKLILKALKIKKNDEIVIQLFTCHSIVEVILNFGAIPVYVEIDQSNLSMSLNSLINKITNKTKIVILQSTYGLLVDAESIVKYVKSISSGIYIVEDVTLSYGMINDEMTFGSYSNICFYSTKFNKIVNTTLGGVVICKNELISKEIELIYNSLIPMSEEDILFANVRKTLVVFLNNKKLNVLRTVLEYFEGFLYSLQSVPGMKKVLIETVTIEHEKEITKREKEYLKTSLRNNEYELEIISFLKAHGQTFKYNHNSRIVLLPLLVKSKWKFLFYAGLSKVVATVWAKSLLSPRLFFLKKYNLNDDDKKLHGEILKNLVFIKLDNNKHALAFLAKHSSLLVTKNE